MDKKLLKFLPMEKFIEAAAPKILDGVCTILSPKMPPSDLFDMSWADVDPDAYLQAVKCIGEYAERWKGLPNVVMTQTDIEKMKRKYNISDRLYDEYFQLSMKEKKIVRVLSKAPVSECTSDEDYYDPDSLDELNLFDA